MASVAFEMSLHFLHPRSVGQKGFWKISKRWGISGITGYNVQKLQIFAIFASKVASTLKRFLLYTQSQKKHTMKSLASPGTQGQSQVTPVGSYFIMRI